MTTPATQPPQIAPEALGLPDEQRNLITPMQLCQLFREIPFLSSLDENDCRAIAPLLTPHHFPPGGILFYEDDPSDSAFFLAEGIVEVFKSNLEGRKLPLLMLRGGGLLGEIGMLIEEPRTATARALSHVTAYRISRHDFNEACQNNNHAALDLTLCFARTLATRLRATDAKLFDLFESDVSESLLRQLSETRAKLLSRMAQ